MCDELCVCSSATMDDPLLTSGVPHTVGLRRPSAGNLHEDITPAKTPDAAADSGCAGAKAMLAVAVACLGRL